MNSSIPPVLDPALAAAYEDLTTLEMAMRLRRRIRGILALGIDTIPETTITPAHVQLAATTMLPTIRGLRASEIETEAEVLTDWEAIGEARRERYENGAPVERRAFKPFTNLEVGTAIHKALTVTFGDFI